MKLVVLLELSTVALLVLPWHVQGATFRFAASSNRIYLENGGSATLSDIKAALPNAPLDLLDAANRIWLLRANLQIVGGSTLALHGTAAGGDMNELRLLSNNSSVSNSFVSITADWGRIDIRSTKITSWDIAANGPDTEFQSFGRAFIRVRSRLAADGVTANESRMDILNSDISYLGYDASESYGLAWKVSGTHPDPSKSIFDYVNVYGDITGSRLHHNFWGVYCYGMQGARWLNNEVDHNAGYGFDPHDDSDHLLIESNNVHHNGGLGRGTHGIIASKRCDHIVIRNNRSWANAENGIMLHRHCDDALVENNETFLNGDSGIALFDSDRIAVRNNLILSNANAGIRLSVGCSDNVIANNEIACSGENGLHFYPGPDPAEPDPVDPTLTNRNRRHTIASNYVHHCALEGIRMVDGDDNVFIGNEFSANAPELSFVTSARTRLIGNLIPPNVTVELSGSTSVRGTTFFKEQPLVRLALADANSAATFEDDDGAIFVFAQNSIATHVNNQRSFVTVTAAEIGAGSTVTTRELFVGLNTGEATVSVNPTLWGSGGESRKQWTSQATTASASIRYTVGDLSANRSYTVLKNGQALSSVTANSSGQVSFTDVPGTNAAVQYALAPASEPPPLPTVTVVDSDGNAAESGANTGSFRITRSGSTVSALTVRYSLGGSAVNGADYSTLPGSVNIPVGSSSATIVVNTIDDGAVEGSENVVLTLTSDAAYVIGSPNSATVDMEDNDREPPSLPTVTVVASDAKADENGPTPGAFTISRSGSTAAALTVRYSVSGTATRGSDYAALPGSVNIPAGSSSANIAVNPIDDSLKEGNETVVLTLVPDAAYTVGSPNRDHVNIADKEDSSRPTVTVVATAPNASENRPGTFTFIRTKPGGGRLTVKYSVGGTAVNGSDYARLSGSVDIPSGNSSASVTVMVDPVDDTVDEDNETVVLTLTPDAAYEIGSPASATVTITDNDEPTLPAVSVLATDIVCAESGPNPGTFTIARSGSTASDLTVRYSVGGTAVNGSDCARLSGSVTIRAGNESAAVVVQPVDDNSIELAELITLTLTADPSYHISALLNTAALSILDNDLLGLDFATSLAPALVVTPPAPAVYGQANSKLALAWNADAGRRYQLQYKSDWNATNWINLGDAITATNDSAIASDVIGSEPQRFYRLVLLP